VILKVAKEIYIVARQDKRLRTNIRHVIGMKVESVFIDAAFFQEGYYLILHHDSIWLDKQLGRRRAGSDVCGEAERDERRL
jgi:hypothetical protein